MNDGDDDRSNKKEVLKTSDKIRDIEFRLINDLSSLKEMSTDSQNYRSKDINMLKLILCSGLYPQVAIADEFNNYKRDCDQFFHTKVCVFQRPSFPHSIFFARPNNSLYFIQRVCLHTIRITFILQHHRKQTPDLTIKNKYLVISMNYSSMCK